MPRYKYEKLTVLNLKGVEYPITEIRQAVEHLKTLKQAKGTGLEAQTSVRAGRYWLLARPLLKLNQIIGRTPREVWELFDADVDGQRESLKQRDSLSYAPPNHRLRLPRTWRPLGGYLSG